MSRERLPWWHGVLAVAGGIALALFLGGTDLLKRLDFEIFDSFLRQRNRGVENPSKSDGVSVVAVSNSDVTRLNRPFPWPREEQSVIFEKLGERSPSVVVIDLLYPEPTTPESDGRLAFQLAACKNVVSAFYFDPKEGRPKVMSELLGRSGSRMAADLSEAEWPTFFSGPAIPARTIAPGITRVGHAHTIPDEDGLIRSLPLVVSDGKRLYPSLALQAVLLHWDVGWEQLHLKKSGLKIVDIPGVGTLDIPLDPMGRMLLDYRAELPKRFPATEVFGLMDGEEFPAEGRIVCVGSLVTGHGDIYATPVSSETPGLLINALAVDQLLRRDFIAGAGWWAKLLFLAASVLITAIIFLAFRLLVSGIAFIVVIAGIVATSYFLLKDANFWLAPGSSIIGSAVAAISLSLSHYIFIIRHHKKTVSAFGRYLGPNLSEILSKNPEAFDGVAKRKMITIFFSDIVAYTAISETLESEELLGMLNRYFDRMTDIAFSRGATVSKYMGDGMMVFFNEPVDQPDHPDRAVVMGLEMLEALPDLNREFEGEGLPPLSVRIGINTGYAHVGKVGSAGFSDFTVIGSSVNLAARIMGKAEPGELLVGAKTKAMSHEDFDWVAHGEFIPKGFKEPEVVYRVTPPDQSAAG